MFTRVANIIYRIKPIKTMEIKKYVKELLLRQPWKIYRIQTTLISFARRGFTGFLRADLAGGRDDFFSRPVYTGNKTVNRIYFIFIHGYQTNVHNNIYCSILQYAIRLSLYYLYLASFFYILLLSFIAVSRWSTNCNVLNYKKKKKLP